MILFKERKKIEEKYYEWIHSNNLKDSPFNVVTYLASMNYLNEDNIKDDLKKEKTKNEI